jgi:hypothetical protein
MRTTRPLIAGIAAGAVMMAVLLRPARLPAAQEGPLPTADGYRGIWYFNQPTKDEYRYKYSGGMATYPQQHVPIAVYARQVNRTFFCYGGTSGDNRTLLHMVSYYDHATGRVPRPTILLDKETTDAHDNPTMQVDDQGHIWIFSSAHGTGRPSYIHRSRKPYDISAFELVEKTNFSYTQPWHIPGAGFLFLHTRYQGGQRALHWMTSPDGRQWEAPRPLAHIQLGDYQVSWSDGRRVGTAFDFHPRPGGLNARTNLYYLETGDLGKTWKTVTGKVVQTPITEPQNPALVHDYQAEGRLVYLKDVTFNAEGGPVILYLTSKGYAPGPASGPYEWWTAEWTGRTWRVRPFTPSDHNYDHGSLYAEADSTWRVIAPTEPGPQPFGTGGEMVLWTSRDRGGTWTRVRALTGGSERNHTYARRPVNAHPDFYALWADGDARKPSVSYLYFTDRTGEKVWRLPAHMTGESARPEAVRLPR